METILTRRFDALVLAGRRQGEDDLAIEAGAPHRALLDIHGVPMLARVISTLTRVPSIRRILVSIDRPELLFTSPAIAAAMAQGVVRPVAAGTSPSRSVAAVLESGNDLPLLVTTADHALLTPEMVTTFLDEALERNADLAFALVSAETVKARFPESRRTYVPFRDDGYSGANLFAFLTPAARRGAEFWVRAERFRKQPWKLARAFGLWSLVLFLLRRLDLAEAMRRASRAIGIRIEAVALPFAEAAVDVDRMSDLVLVRQILAPGAAPLAAEAV